MKYVETVYDYGREWPVTERVGIEIEIKKNSLKQLQSGDWVVSFTASQIDFPTELAMAAMGQRFMAVLVPLGDFEEAPKPKEDKHKLSRQAAMLCDDARFWAFLNEFAKDALFGTLGNEGVHGPYDAANAIRRMCEVDSRAEFDKNPEAAQKWRNLKASFEAWLNV